MAGTAEHCDGEDIDANAEMIGSTEHYDGEDVDADVDKADATDHVEAEQETINPDDEKDSISMAEEMAGTTDHIDTEQETHKPDDKATKREDDTKAPPQIFQLTISLPDDWLHRGDALQDMGLQTCRIH